MKLSAAIKVVVFTGALAAIGCQEVRPASPTAPSLFIPNLQGVWSGPMILWERAGESAPAQSSAVTACVGSRNNLHRQRVPDTAAITMESTGLACRYTGTSTLTSLAMNADRAIAQVLSLRVSTARTAS